MRVGADAAGRRRCEVRPRQALGRIVSAAYGPQPEDVILRLHRGLSRAATAIEAGDLCLAGIETVLLRLPDLTPSGARQARRSRRAGERRDSLAGRAARPGRTAGRRSMDDRGRRGRRARRRRQARGARLSSRDHSRSKSPSPARRRSLSARGRRPAHHPDRRRGGRRGVSPVERAAGRFHASRRRVPRPPGCARPGRSLGAHRRLFRRQRWSPTKPIWTRRWANTGLLSSDIKQVDPTFADDELFPPGGIDGLTWQGRTNLINNLRMQRAAAYYRILGDVGPLQVETLRFLQDAVDDAYEEAVSEADAGRLQPDCRERRRSATG